MCVFFRERGCRTYCGKYANVERREREGRRKRERKRERAREKESKSERNLFLFQHVNSSKNNRNIKS